MLLLVTFEFADEFREGGCFPRLSNSSLTDGWVNAAGSASIIGRSQTRGQTGDTGAACRDTAPGRLGNWLLVCLGHDDGVDDVDHAVVGDDVSLDDVGPVDHDLAVLCGQAGVATLDRLHGA